MIFWGTIYVIIKQKNWFWHLCRVQKPWHTAKIWTLPCATSAGHAANIWPRQRSWLATLFCRGSKVAHGKPFVVCPIYSTRQRPALPMPGCRVRFAVCGTRQRVCRGLLGLYRVPLAHGKGGVSRSEIYIWHLGATWVPHTVPHLCKKYQLGMVCEEAEAFKFGSDDWCTLLRLICNNSLSQQSRP